MSSEAIRDLERHLEVLQKVKPQPGELMNWVYRFIVKLVSTLFSSKCPVDSSSFIGFM